MGSDSILLNAITKMLNVGGSAIVAAYDIGADTFNAAISTVSPGEKIQLRVKVKETERKVQSLYAELGKLSAKYDDPVEAMSSEAVVAIVGNIKELNKDIEAIKQRIIEIETTKPEQAKPAAKSAPMDTRAVVSFFGKAISNSMAAYLPSERKAFEQKIAEHEKNIHSLYGELGKVTVGFEDPAEALHAEPTKDIIARINVQKDAVETLKAKIAALSPVEKAPVKAKSGAAPVQKTAVPETAEEDEESLPPSPVWPEAAEEVDAPEIVADSEDSAEVPEQAEQSEVVESVETVATAGEEESVEKPSETSNGLNIGVGGQQEAQEKNPEKKAAKKRAAPKSKAASATSGNLEPKPKRVRAKKTVDS
ncbi:MAG: hypothetical protein OEV89_07340 [Desulfobulbaceae bacterium]|nr:hypothetical protein [Desulfobulbaceae bacterium]HIJ90566.1 hypothetical protein [Deltaproteobacteria bacterium]